MIWDAVSSYSDNFCYGSATNKNNFSSEACSEVAICGLKSIQSVKVSPQILCSRYIRT